MSRTDHATLTYLETVVFLCQVVDTDRKREVTQKNKRKGRYVIHNMQHVYSTNT